MSRRKPADDWQRMPYGKRAAFTAQLVQRYGWQCCICGLPIRSRRDLSCQHLTPRSKGGITTIETCRPAHRSCNYSMKDKESGGSASIIHDGLAAFTEKAKR